MRERGIHFNSEMVRAVMEGRKTQTRWIVNPEPDSPQLLESRTAESGCVYAIHANRSNVHQGRFRWDCPFGQPGDRLWVRETARCEFSREDFTNQVFRTNVAYRADGKSKTFETNKPSKWFPDRTNLTAAGELPWCPSIHMPRWASRITLEITSVRVERLNSMTESDALAEGCNGGRDSIPGYMYSATPHEHFHHVWQSIYGKESWQANPWVWVIEFKRVEGQ